MNGRRMVSGSRGALLATWLATRTFGTFSRRVGGAFAIRLWFTPWRLPVDEPTRQRERRWVAGTCHTAFEVDDLRLHGWEAGDGPTVLLVHGWGDRAASLGGVIKPLVSSGLRVVGVDLPGHGGSPSGPTDPYSLADIVRSVADQVDARAVVAHSIGGAVTLLAVRDGLHLDAAVLVAPVVRAEHALGLFQRMFRLPDRAMDGLRTRLEDRFGTDVWRDVAADRVAADLDLPALVLHDVADTRVSHDDARMLAEAWPTATLVTTDGLGHTRILRDPDAVGRIGAFLAEALCGHTDSPDPATVELEVSLKTM